MSVGHIGVTLGLEPAAKRNTLIAVFAMYWTASEISGRCW
ncbi:hypothetical protein BJ994_003079 [Arthrobacter pigmenti]|uniref:Uncharacterized protein n=1 Tax=Arthrobacter pigmenti TaxID=271432 RepID=A0A846RLB3_9MICC|nr:hypothetical protein [Arthrobacter pigmenti]